MKTEKYTSPTITPIDIELEQGIAVSVNDNFNGGGWFDDEGEEA